MSVKCYFVFPKNISDGKNTIDAHSALFGYWRVNDGFKITHFLILRADELVYIIDVGELLYKKVLCMTSSC